MLHGNRTKARKTGEADTVLDVSAASPRRTAKASKMAKYKCNSWMLSLLNRLHQIFRSLHLSGALALADTEFSGVLTINLSLALSTDAIAKYSFSRLRWV